MLSPLLFNLYMSHMPLPGGCVDLTTYADNSFPLASGPKVEEICEELNGYLEALQGRFKSRRLTIAPAKSTATLFTTFSNELGKPLPIKVGGAQVPTVRYPKFLGITFDGLLNFGEHARHLRTRMQARNNVLKALAGQAWGLTTELMVATYKTIERSLANYCTPTWTPNLSATNWQMLQVQQNAAPRTALGCVKMTPVDDQLRSVLQISIFFIKNLSLFSKLEIFS